MDQFTAVELMLSVDIEYKITDEVWPTGVTFDGT